ncbi:MAG: hypothetical protein ACE5HO_03465 [bacterium]
MVEIIQNVLSDVDFDKELIKRFFHPKSYFFYCISHQLELILDHDHSNNDDYLLFGNLLDKILNSENKVVELEKLAQIRGFATFYETLNQGVSRLRDSDLDTEQMKIEIERLAQSLVTTTLNALHSQAARLELDHYLGLQKKNSQVLHVEESTTDLAETVATDETLAGEPLPETVPTLEQGDHAESIVEPENNESNHEPPSAVSENAVTDVPLESPPDFSELDGQEEKDFLQNTSVGREASAEDGTDYDIAKEGGSDFSPQTQSNYVSREPASIVNAFQDEIEELLADLQYTFDKLNNTLPTQEFWQTCQCIFENIKESSMIYGFEAFEQIATKAQHLCAPAANRADDVAGWHLTRIRETLALLNRLNFSEAESFDEAQIREHVQKMGLPPEEDREQPVAAEKPEKPAAENPLPSVDPVVNHDPVQDTPLETPNGSPGQGLPQELNIARNQSDPATGSQITLPGEDDVEIKKLIGELSNGTSASPVEEAGMREEAVDPWERSEDLNEEIVDRLSWDTQEAKFDGVQVFKEEAALYFNLIDDALQILQEQPNNRKALEDLELTAKSIQNLCVKLNLEPLCKLPEAIEALVVHLMGTDTELAQSTSAAIREAYSHLRKVERLEDAEKREFKQLVTRIQELNYSVPTDWDSSRAGTLRIASNRNPH